MYKSVIRLSIIKRLIVFNWGSLLRKFEFFVTSAVDIAFSFNNWIYQRWVLLTLHAFYHQNHIYFLQFAAPFSVSNLEPNIIQYIIRRYISICFRETRFVYYKKKYVFTTYIYCITNRKCRNFYKEQTSHMPSYYVPHNFCPMRTS